MAYERINWQNGEVGNTPLNANNLNRMDMTLEEHDQKIGDHDYEIENLKTGAQGITEELNKKMDRINPQGSGTFSIPAVNADNITAQTVEADEIKVTKVGSKGGTAPVVFDNDILVSGITTPIGSLASSASSKAESASGRAEEAYTLASRANREAASAINLANDNKAKIDLHTGLIGEGVGDKEVPVLGYLDGYYIAPNGRVTQYNATATVISIDFLDFFFNGDNIIFNHVDLLPTENCIPCAWFDISGNFISAVDGLNIIAEIDEQTFKITKQYIDSCIIPIPAGANSCKMSGLANGRADIRIQTSLSEAIKDLQSKPEPVPLVLTNPSPLPATDGKKIIGIHAKGNSTQNGTPTPTNPIEIIDASEVVKAIGKNLFDGQNVTSGKYIGDDGSIGNDNPSAYTDLIMVAPNTTYTFSALSGGGGRKRIHAYDSNGNWIKLLGSVLAPSRGTAMSLKVTTPSNAKYIRLSYSFNNAYEGGANNDKNVQIEVGASASAYEEYQSNSIALPHTLLSVGTVADELIVNEDGSGKLIRRVSTATYDGTEASWKQTATDKTFYLTRDDSKLGDIVFPTDSNFKGEGLCSHFEIHARNGIALNQFALTSGYNIMFYHSTQTIDEWKAWLSQNPITVYAVLKTPIETPLTASEVASIRQLMTYKGTTVIDSEMQIDSVTYAGDIKAYIDYRIEQIINPTALSSLSDMPDSNETEE